MQYINGISIFDICQAYQQLESDYNMGGWVRERPSNQRRNESISCQLSRIGYSAAFRWVDIETEDFSEDDQGDDNVRYIYCLKVLEWGLPMDEELKATIKRQITDCYLKKHHPSLFE